MFHRVSQQNETSQTQSQKLQDSDTRRTEKMGGEKPQSPMQNLAQRSQNSSSNASQDMPKRAPAIMNQNQSQSSQQKETKEMNAENSDNKSLPQGGYQPTPAQSRMDIPGSRPASAPRAPSTPAYPGSAASSPSYSPTPAASQDADQKKLQIGKGITLSGEIEDCEYLFVEGTVEAALKGANTLEIAESGAFYGTVEIEDARIAGRFEGELTAKGRLTIESTGSITGTIAYKELAIEAGGSLEGKVMPLDSKGEVRVTEGNFAKGKAKKAANAARGENELPFSDKAAAGAAQ